MSIEQIGSQGALTAPYILEYAYKRSLGPVDRPGYDLGAVLGASQQIVGLDFHPRERQLELAFMVAEELVSLRETRLAANG